MQLSSAMRKAIRFLSTLAVMGFCMSSVVEAQQSISCRLQDISRDSMSSFTPAEFTMILTENFAMLKRDQYFNRSFKPCFDGIRDECSMNFGIDRGRFMKLERASDRKFRLTQRTIYGADLDIQLIFSAKIEDMQKRRVTMYLYGLGGDVDWVDGDEFLCYIAATN